MDQLNNTIRGPKSLGLYFVMIMVQEIPQHITARKPSNLAHNCHLPDRKMARLLHHTLKENNDLQYLTDILDWVDSSGTFSEKGKADSLLGMNYSSLAPHSTISEKS